MSLLPSDPAGDLHNLIYYYYTTTTTTTTVFFHRHSSRHPSPQAPRCLPCHFDMAAVNLTTASAHDGMGLGFYKQLVLAWPVYNGLSGLHWQMKMSGWDWDSRRASFSVGSIVVAHLDVL